MATSTGYYLYGFTDYRHLENISVDAVAGNGHIQNIPFQGIGILCSPVNGKKLKPTRENLMNHQKVLETWMEKHTILPVRFGVVAQTKGALQKGINSSLPIIRSHLQKFQNKIELNLKAFWEKDYIYDYLQEKYPEIKRFRNAVKKMRGTTAHHRSIELGQMVERGLIAEGEREADEIIRELESASLLTKKTKIFGELMYLNLAILVSKDGESKLDKTINSIATDRQGKSTFKYVGPSAPASFVNLHLKF